MGLHRVGRAPAFSVTMAVTTRECVFQYFWTVSSLCSFQLVKGKGTKIMIQGIKKYCGIKKSPS